MTPVITGTSLSPNDREKVIQIVEALGWTFNPHLTSDVTHLVATRVGSEKCTVAKAMRIPIVSISWLEECRQRAKEGLDSLSEHLIEKHRCLPLYGLQVCLSGFDAGTRQCMQAVIEKLGATFHSDLSRGTTHLISNSSSGQKYCFAIKWNIPVVNSKWLKECILTYDCADEKKFKVFPSPESSFHTSILSGCNFFLFHDLSDAERLKIVLIAMALGANIFDHCTPEVTHIITDDVLSSLSSYERQSGARCVTRHWVHRCFKELSRISEDAFELDAPQTITTLATDETQLDIGPAFSELDRNMSSRMDLTPPKNYNLSPVAPKQSRSPFSIVNTDLPHMLSSQRISLSTKTPKRRVFDRLSGFKQPQESKTILSYDHTMKNIGVDTSNNLLFSNMDFAIVGFLSEEMKFLSTEIMSRGGAILETYMLPHRKSPWYIIAPLAGSVKPSSRCDMGIYVTDFWVECCIEGETLCRIDSEFFYSPLKNPVPLSGFETVVMSVTGIEGIEREHIGRIVKLLGGTYTEALTRKNTHLIANWPSSATSQKVKKAEEWNLHVITKEWLAKCCQMGYAVSVEKFRARDYRSPSVTTTEKEPQSFTSNPSRHLRSNSKMKHQSSPLALKAEEFESMSKLPIVEDKAESDHTPIKKGEISAGQIYMPKFDFSFAINTERKSSPPASPLDATFSKNLGLAVKRVTASPLKTSKTSDMELHEPKIPQGLFASEHLTPREKDSAKILDGVYICLSSKVQNRRHQIAKVCQKLGASLLASFSNICTHLVHEGQRQNEVLKEFKQAKQAGLPIVSPYWLFDCEDRNMRLNEMNYPHTFNPNKTLRISASTQGPYSTQSISSRKMQKFLLPTKSDLNTDQSSDDLEKEFADLPKKDSKVDVSMAFSPTYQRKEDKLKEDIVPVEVKAKKPNVLKFVDAVNQILVHKKMESESTHGTTSSVIHEASSKRPVMGWTLDDLDMSKDDISKDGPIRNVSSKSVDGSESSTGITYDDPVARFEKRKLLEQLETGKNSKRVKESPKSSREAPSESKPETSSPPKGRYDRKFIATGVSPELRKEMTKLIERLGGVFLDSEHWVPECTHLIAETITRTEKCLAALASGCWILKPGYVDASDRAGVFVNEDAWEWLQDNDDSTSLAAAIRPWRLRLGNYADGIKRAGAFKGWTVLLVMDHKKGNGFARVLKAGMADVDIMSKSRASRLDISEVVRYNHCVIESSSEKTALTITLKNADVKILPSNFLLDFFLQPKI